MKSTSDPETTFIVFTICPEFHSAYKKEKLELYGISSENDYRYNSVWYPTMNKTTSKNGREIFHDITHELHELIDIVEISTQSLARPKIVIDTQKELNKIYVEFSTKYVDTFGRCYTMKPARDLLDLGVTKVEFVSYIGVYVFLEHPGQHLHVNSRSKVICKL